MLDERGVGGEQRTIERADERAENLDAIGVRAEHRQTGGAVLELGFEARLRDVHADADEGAAGSGFDEHARELAAADDDVVGPLDADACAEGGFGGLGGGDGTSEREAFGGLRVDDEGHGDSHGRGVGPVAAEAPAAGGLSPRRHQRARVG